uniref:Transmembrane protein 195 n=1 Tax=Phallusia mammillata TaxID=59560 RepID=A0A6F9D6V1_9ASCI|nr:alkylglycerol monooxygenase-like [Phallusia mammillata]
MNNKSDSLLIPHSNSYRPGLAESFRSLFYCLGPSESLFEDISKVPNYTDAAVVCFICLMLLELFISLWKDWRTLRINDGITSLSAGVISRLATLISKRSVELTLYIYVYDHWRLADLPWNSYWTWILAFLGMDFFYYWGHRASHEVNFIWAAHQAHHSSEDYNFTTALRQSTTLSYITMWLYIGNALLIPPSVYLVHSQLNTLYQFWIHTEVIESIGPLEYILNTPSHHRVHHGRNPYCIDKNYGGTLIIWDRIFGTFVAEKKDVRIAYGLVQNINTFNPIKVQLGHYKDLFHRAWQINGLWNKVCVFLKGPGWRPGKPRLGDPTEIPEVKNPIQCYNPQISGWMMGYGFVHYFSLIPMYDNMLTFRHKISGSMIVFDLIFFLGSFTCISMLFDKK